MGEQQKVGYDIQGHRKPPLKTLLGPHVQNFHQKGYCVPGAYGCGMSEITFGLSGKGKAIGNAGCLHSRPEASPVVS